MSSVDYMETPVGQLMIKASDKGVTHVLFTDRVDEETADEKKSPSAITEQCKQQLQEYFSGTRTDFTIPCDATGTDFQQSVWQQLLTVAYGEVASYRDIADKIHNPKAVRAVGAANGKNPISIIVPCHRVIGSNGSLTGYAGGLNRKTWLLQHETKHRQPVLL